MQKAHGPPPWSGGRYNLFFSQVQALLPIHRAAAGVLATALPVWTMVTEVPSSHCSSLPLPLKCKSNYVPALLDIFIESPALGKTPTQPDIKASKDKGTALFQNLLSPLFLPPHILGFPNGASY